MHLTIPQLKIIFGFTSFLNPLSTPACVVTFQADSIVYECFPSTPLINEQFFGPVISGIPIILEIRLRNTALVF